MSSKLTEVIESAEALPIEEQLNLIAHLAQRLSNTKSTNQQSLQSDRIQAHIEPQKQGKSIWQIAEDFVRDTPLEELNKLPPDGAEQHDHYIYGTAKIES
jgi:hypothetical protein